ncbi:MAG: MCP four helix bundle domain-containing protein [Tepidisphaeraceae bacterium]
MFTYTKLGAISTASESVTQDALPGLKQIFTITANQRLNVANMVQYMHTKDDAKAKELEVTMKAISANSTEMYAAYEKSIFTDEDRRLYEELKAARVEYTNSRKKMMELTQQAGGREAALSMFEGQVMPAVKKYDDALMALVKLNSDTGDKATDTLQASVASGIVGLWIGVGAAVIVGATLAVMIIRSVSKALTRMADSLADGSNQVAAAATQVSSSSQSLAQGASEQAASLEETSSSLEEMSSMVSRNADTPSRRACSAPKPRRRRTRGTRRWRRCRRPSTTSRRVPAKLQKL